MVEGRHRGARRTARLAALGALVLFTGCEGAAQGPTSDEVSSTSSPITGGSEASSFPEAALVGAAVGGSLREGCSGALIAPRVILTAGHCVVGYSWWRITLPYSGGQQADTASAAVYDWTGDAASDTNNQHHDVGLIFLNSAMSVSSLPAHTAIPRDDGTSVVNVGRTHNGVMTNQLWQGQVVTITTAPNPTYYLASQKIIEPGDSGGPVYGYNSLGGWRTIVAVNSGINSAGQARLARIDLVFDWIQQQISAHQ